MVNVIGVPLYNLSIPQASKEVIVYCKLNTPLNYCISATGAHGMVYASKNPDFKEILKGFYINLPDGMPGVWIGRLKGAKQMQRCYGPDFFEYLLTHSAATNIKHFFCGGKEGVADALKTASEQKFNNHNIVGTFCPPFREMSDEEMAELGKKIVDSKADVVWIGLSTPKQEKFAWRLRNFTSTNFIITVGAAFDFHTGNVKQAPKWVQKSGIEWFFRMMMEPKRLFKRYVEVVPQFIWLNIKELITGSSHKINSNLVKK